MQDFKSCRYVRQFHTTMHPLCSRQCIQTAKRSFHLYMVRQVEDFLIKDKQIHNHCRRLTQFQTWDLRVPNQTDQPLSHFKNHFTNKCPANEVSERVAVWTV